MLEFLKKTKYIVTNSEKMSISLPRNAVQTQTLAGLLLVLATIAALIIANSPLFSFYNYILEGVEFRIGFSETGGDFHTEIRKSLLHWINDGLMVLFFFVIGLEIKRELLSESLAKQRERLILPALAALGGMAIPAFIFWFTNKDTPVNLTGWAIPMATDIAFALAIISILGDRVPRSLKLLLTMIAIIDDVGAILIIALFYSESIHIAPLYIAAVALIILATLNRKSVTSVGPYALAGALLWVCVLESGIHATMAGVVAALFIPLKGKDGSDYSPLKHLESDLYPVVMFAVIPVFAFANAGVPFKGMEWADLLHPVTVGIFLGLFLGKQLGIFATMWLAIKTGLCKKPDDVTWRHLYAISVLCGIGFTMSLFIGLLSYQDIGMQASVRIGVLSASLLSALTGFLLLYKHTDKREK